MFDHLRNQWRSFRSQPAGERFQQRYRQRATRSGALRKAAVMVAGVVLILLGIAMIVLPGPGLLAIVFGAGLVAEESLFAARMLDRVERALRRRLDCWRRAPR
ncbi:MAG TPA: PGPGW domain-containing protein [Dokdonella sp.]